MVIRPEIKHGKQKVCNADAAVYIDCTAAYVWSLCWYRIVVECTRFVTWQRKSSRPFESDYQLESDRLNLHVVLSVVTNKVYLKILSLRDTSVSR